MSNPRLDSLFFRPLKQTYHSLRIPTRIGRLPSLPGLVGWISWNFRFGDGSSLARSIEVWQPQYHLPSGLTPLKTSFFGVGRKARLPTIAFFGLGFMTSHDPIETSCLGGGNSKFFLEFSHRTLGKMNTMLTVAYLSRGWFNHQLANVCQKKGRADVFLFPRRLGSMKKLDWLWRKCNMDHGAVCKSIWRFLVNLLIC